LGVNRSLRWTLLGLAVPSAAAALVILFLSLSAFGTLQGSATQALMAKDVVADILPPPLYLIEMRLVVSQAVEQTLTPEEATGRWRKLAADYQERAAYWREHAPPTLRQHLLGEQHERAERFIDIAGHAVLDRLAAGERDAALQGLHDAEAAYQAHRAAVDDTVRVGSQFADAAIADFGATTARGYWIMPLAAAALLGLSSVLGMVIYRGLVGAVRQCSNLAHRVAAGDLSQRAVSSRRDELGDLVRAMDDMSQRLATLVGSVRDGSHAIAQATAQIAQGNQDLSARTETQASHLQETAASVEQMASSMSNNTDTARRADHLAKEASGIAVQGHSAVATLVATMSDIQTSSRRIGDIIGVIDGIAFQTNILALNAAVEAARAGEQGRGFAVVAAEVRNLAQRSADAAREIKDLILASTEQVEGGAVHADHAGSTIAAIVDQVAKVTTLVREISTASGQQTSGFAQINGSLEQIDAATQQNSALVEQIAAAATNLRDQTVQLSRAVDVFRLA
jgi:methyl-accepting chemotaxis protein